MKTHKSKVPARSNCKCENCKLGRDLQKIVNKYKMDKSDSWYLLDTIFGYIEHLECEVFSLKEKLND